MSQSTLNKPRFRLARVLAARLLEEKNYSRLAEAISLANGLDLSAPRLGDRRQKHIVDRRKLRKIVDTGPEGTDLCLSLEELHALSIYLERFNEGLANNPIFERVQVLQHLAERGNIEFLVASRPQEEFVDLSHWDVKSLAVIQRAMNQISRSCRFDLHDVLLRSDVPEARAELVTPRLQRILGEAGASLVCIGSPRASHAAEAMLATMLGYEPFVSPGGDSPPPFLFAWSVQPEDGHRLPSCVAIRGNELRNRAPEVAAKVGHGEARALLIGQKHYISEFPCEQATQAYGIVAVQQRPQGQLWMVVAGLSGIGTFATAHAVARIPDILPRTPLGQASPVLWAAIEADVVLDQQRDSIRVPRLIPNRAIRVIHGPALLSPARGNASR